MGDEKWVKVEKKDTGATVKKKPYYIGYQGKNPRNTCGGITIEQKESEGSTPELKGYYFDTGTDQVDNYKKTIKNIVILAGMKYSAEITCAIYMMIDIPPMLKLPTKPTLERLQAADTIQPLEITEVPEEYEDLYK